MNVVKSWNPNSAEPTKSVYLGLLGVYEGGSRNCGGITSNLVLRDNVLGANFNWKWELAEDWQSHRIYLFDNAKTIENVAKFMRDMQERCISYMTANIQSEVFLKALTIIQEVPGDWHTSLNVLT